VLDPDNVGLEHWHTSATSTQTPGTDGSATEDPRASFARKRMQCYDLVKDSVIFFEEKYNAQAKNQTSTASLDDPEAVRNHAYELAFASDDEMFHSVLYDWLIERGLADDLLEVRCLSRCRGVMT
jgi:nuclear pore complex protein Nup155